MLARLFQTGWFVESLLTQTLIVHIIRTRRMPVLRQPGLPAHDADYALAVMAIGAWLPYSPFAGALWAWCRCPPIYWAWIGGISRFAYAVLTHFVKTWFFKRYGGD